jgi:hypothetical protein
MGFDRDHRQPHDERVRDLARIHELDLGRARDVMRRAQEAAIDDPELRPIEYWFSIVLESDATRRAPGRATRYRPQPGGARGWLEQIAGPLPPDLEARIEAVVGDDLDAVAPPRALAAIDANAALRHELEVCAALVDGAEALLRAARRPPEPGALPATVRARFERAFGVDFGDVRVHEDGAADAEGAEAFARGTDLHFAPGRFDPTTTAGLELIGHELAHVVQQAHGRAHGESPELEREADRLGAAAARGPAIAPIFAPAPLARTAAAVVQRKSKVNPVASALEDKLAVLGDGTPGKPGKTIPELDAYVRAQADWFAHPDFSTAATAVADRAAVWRSVKLVSLGFHATSAMPTFHVGEIAKLPAADLARLEKYIRCFDTSAWTIQLSTAAPTLARAIALGKAITELEAFVPAAVMKLVIPAAGLDYLVDKIKVAELETFFKTFTPTLEKEEEWPFIVAILDKGVASIAALAPWMHDPHVFTEASRTQLLKNITNKGRSHPVTLVLFSALDWNKAFLQGKELEKLILDTRNLTLVVQGPASLAAAAAEVNRVADDYGQLSWSWNPMVSWKPVAKAQLGQVVIAGHGSDQSVELAAPGTGAWVDEQNKRVGYDHADIDSKNDPKKNGTELLFKTVIERMDPAHVDIVFAGCLVNSHEVDAATPLGGSAATAQKALQDALKAHPNLADYVRAQITAMGATGKVTAANASATFGSFKMDPATGKATINGTDPANPTREPDLGGTKLEYLRTGAEPEGVLRAAIECYASMGPAAVSTEIRTKLAGLAGKTEWWQTITRVGLELCMPAVGDVDPKLLLDVVHRIRSWFSMLWVDESNPAEVATNTKAPEATTVFPAMLASDVKAWDHIAVGVNEAWIKFDATKGADFMTALTASKFIRETFHKHLARGVVDKELATLLPVSATPTRGQLLLALTIAWQSKKTMPKPARDLLRAAAGGVKTSTFPAALGADALLKPVSELSILESIDLAPSSATTSGSGVTTNDGNVDANADGKNETYIEVAPREAQVTATVLNVRARASTSSKVIDTVKLGDIVLVMGVIEGGAWTFVDHGGKRGFMASRYLI